ncbi:peptide chain release factor N(5)-glutamine methyltransferase [Arcanobacterium ihumii]|uniref:peptide chain release factor N(5)-glutamine methyltransferase n=1 Tax=Arcanobacterium ihumii TaxID=2138162 RepID=UPI000F5423C7|nr:peptide chain release factor N(5)-glutamine methyltransferase [Arcanobacterium ihumii]
MIWNDIYKNSVDLLMQAGVASATHDAKELAEYSFGRVPFASETPDSDQLAMYDDAIERRAQRVPLQHIIGKMWFRFLELESRPGVFITRPETELVAQAAIDELQKLIQSGVEHPRVVDLCAGSGAIAIAIATEVPHADVSAVELSKTAFASIEQNNKRYGGRVRLVHGNALDFNDPAGTGYDVVVSNPPYVPATHKLSEEVLADPSMALFGGGEDGLEFPEKLIDHVATLVKTDGLFIMEHADEQGKVLRDYASHFFRKCGTGQDYNGSDRWLWARK